MIDGFIEVNTKVPETKRTLHFVHKIQCMSWFEFLELQSLCVFKMSNVVWYLDKDVNNGVIIQSIEMTQPLIIWWSFLFIRSPTIFGKLQMYTMLTWWSFCCTLNLYAYLLFITTLLFCKENTAWSHLRAESTKRKANA